MIKQNRQLTTGRLVEITDFSNGTIETIINNYFGHHTVTTRWVYQILTPRCELKIVYQ